MNCCSFPSSLDSKKKKFTTHPLTSFIPLSSPKGLPTIFPTSPLSKLKALKHPKQTESYSTQELSSKTIFHSSSLGDTTVLLSLLGGPSPQIIITNPVWRPAWCGSGFICCLKETILQYSMREIVSFNRDISLSIILRDKLTPQKTQKSAISTPRRDDD